MSIDQEENKADENKAGNPAKALEPTKLSVLQQKLLEGIEKTKVSWKDKLIVF
jgi:hypothetical protein